MGCNSCLDHLLEIENEHHFRNFSPSKKAIIRNLANHKSLNFFLGVIYIKLPTKRNLYTALKLAAKAPARFSLPKRKRIVYQSINFQVRKLLLVSRRAHRDHYILPTQTMDYHRRNPSKLYHLESGWRNSHVFVYHSPLLSHLFGGRAIYFPDGIPKHEGYYMGDTVTPIYGKLSHTFLTKKQHHSAGLPLTITGGSKGSGGSTWRPMKWFLKCQFTIP